MHKFTIIYTNDYHPYYKDLKKYKECVITASQLLHKQAHLQLTYSQGKAF